MQTLRRPPAVLAAANPVRVSPRYELLAPLGHGGMGSVYRALDRLTGEEVCLKRLRVDASAARARNDTLQAERLALAREFRLLASLRHPNVIGVLDYGFDAVREPFFTMELQPDAVTIVEAGASAPLDVRIDLLVQTLRALAYVHRRGILHRDVKPDNLIVVDGKVKLVDFGLSIACEAARGGGFTGTVAYSAPEVLQGGLPSVGSDLFALGVVAFELLTGRHPFEAKDVASLWQEIVTGPTPASALEPGLAAVIERLLAKRPADRFPSAIDVGDALAAALGRPLELETPAVRESFLQGAAFVGRDAELERLATALRAAEEGRGATWLVGGESGVGKSRLLEELRTLALVRGMVVARGQASSVGGEPFHAWASVVPTLLLSATHVDDRLASELLPLAPAISSLLGRPVAEPPAVDPEAAQTRLLLAFAELLRRQAAPVLVLLEDLQWAGSESLRLLAQVARTSGEAGVLVVASHRSDEAPELPDAVPGCRVLRLGRLERDDVRRLAESMIGAAGAAPTLVEYLGRETEGIPFFLVEVVRSLAEGAGALARLEPSNLPRIAVPGGIQRLLRRRLARVPADAVAGVKAAAVIGRDLGAALLAGVEPALDLADWSASCAAAGVLEVQEAQWRFTHEKLREQVLADLGRDERRSLHRRVASVLEERSDGNERPWAVLAHHWREAGEARREAECAAEAGLLALDSGACAEALAFLTRALPVFQADAAAESAPRKRGLLARLADPNGALDAGGARFRLARLEAALTETHFRLGDLTTCRVHALRAMQLCGLPMPAGRPRFVVGLVRQALRRVVQAASRFRGREPGTAEVGRMMARVETRLIESYFFSPQRAPLAWLALVMTNQCSPLGPSPELAKAFMVLGLLAGAGRMHLLAGAWCRRAVRLSERFATKDELAYLLTRVNNHRLGHCDFSTADAELERAALLAAEVGDQRVWEEARSMQGMSALFQGRYEAGLAAWSDVERSCERSGNLQIACWATMGRADQLVRLGRDAEAARLYHLAIERFDRRAKETERIWAFGMLALASLRLGDEDDALEWANRALGVIARLTQVAYWTQYGTAATAEVFATLAERIDDPSLEAGARRACEGMRAFARVFRLGVPFALLYEGRQHARGGRPGRALRTWRRCATVAATLGLPYERGLAQLEIGRRLESGDPERRQRLDEAAALFRAHGTARDLAAAEGEIARRAHAARLRSGA